MKLAISEAGLEPADIDYINAHGTSTPANEKGESQAIVSSSLARILLFSSTKSFTYHLLGAAGAVEAIAVIEAMKHSHAPMTARRTKYYLTIFEADVNGQGRDMEIKYAISNTFGFGGHNSVVAFKRWED